MKEEKVAAGLFEYFFPHVWGNGGDDAGHSTADYDELDGKKFGITPMVHAAIE